jgi:hypothetical protein
METEGDCLGNRLWKWKRTLWATTYTNSVLQLTPAASYKLWQGCLTAYTNSVLQVMAKVSYRLWQQCLTTYMW